jgi:hypothetical protein
MYFMWRKMSFISIRSVLIRCNIDTTQKLQFSNFPFLIIFFTVTVETEFMWKPLRMVNEPCTHRANCRHRDLSVIFSKWRLWSECCLHSVHYVHSNEVACLRRQIRNCSVYFLFKFVAESFPAASVQVDLLFIHVGLMLYEDQIALHLFLTKNYRMTLGVAQAV